MPELADSVIVAFAVLVVKHTLADYFLQTPYQIFNKGTYGHPGGIIHAGIHAVLTAPVFLVLAPASVVVGILILVAEFVAHYHIDWTKEQLIKRNGWQSDQPQFWRAYGVDQMMHMLTYVLIVAVLAG